MTTNREKVLNGEAVLVTDGRLREMQRIAMANEGAGEYLYHWHWVAVINELIERRVEVERLRHALEMAARRFEYIARGASPDIANAPAGAKEAREALERAASAAESADPLASKDHDLARQAAEETAAEVRAEVARLQARIDALMLEYCPGEMTPEQTAEWARHQVPHQLSAAEREALERESAAVDAVATEPKRAYYETREPPHCPTCGRER